MPDTAIREESLHSTIVESCRPQYVSWTAGDISGLRIIRGSRLVLPVEILLLHKSEFTLWFTIAGGVGASVGSPSWIGPVTFGQIVQVFHQLRLQGAADCCYAEGGKGDDITVEFAAPINEPVPTGIGNEHVTAGTSIGDVFVRWMGVGGIIDTTVCLMVVIHIQQVRTIPAIKVVFTGTAYQPVVAKVTEDHIIAVGHDGQIVYPIRICVQRHVHIGVSVLMIKVEQVAVYLPPRIIFVICGEFTR